MCVHVDICVTVRDYTKHAHAQAQAHAHAHAHTHERIN